VALDEDRIRKIVVRQMTSWLATLPEEARTQPMFAAADGSDALSPADMLNHISQGTPLGNRLLEEAIGLRGAQNLLGGFAPASRERDSYG
jgi:hypothetical protein